LVHLKTPQSLELGLRDCHGRSLALRGMPRNDRREIHPHLTSPFEGETCDGARGKFLEELAPFLKVRSPVTVLSWSAGGDGKRDL